MIGCRCVDKSVCLPLLSLSTRAVLYVGHHVIYHPNQDILRVKGITLYNYTVDINWDYFRQVNVYGYTNYLIKDIEHKSFWKYVDVEMREWEIRKRATEKEGGKRKREREKDNEDKSCICFEALCDTSLTRTSFFSFSAFLTNAPPPLHMHVSFFFCFFKNLTQLFIFS